MANQIENKECLVQCKHCGTVNTAIWKNKLFKHWSVKNCSKCFQKLEVNNMETVLCPHCGKLVEKTPQNLCLACGKLIYQEGKVFRALCRNCGMTNLIPFDHVGKVTCLVCGSDQLERMPDPRPLPAQYIKLKDQKAMLDEHLIVYKHPLNSFPAGSRIQVSQGTWGLVLQNGACRQYPYSPDSYPLNTSDDSQEKKLADIANGKDVNIDTEIFCVLKTLPEIRWGGYAQVNVPADANVETLVQNSGETRDYTIKANGMIVWEIVDAKAFMNHFGFMEIKGEEGILKVDTRAGSEDGELIRETRDQICDALKTVAQNIIGLEELDPIKLLYKQAEIEKQMIIELDRLMDQMGLVVRSFRIKEYKIEEADADLHDLISRTIQKDFKWETKDVRLFPGSNKRFFADYTFSGNARLKIADEKTVYGLTEVKNAGKDALKLEGFFVAKLNEAVFASAAPVAQNMIDDEQINIQELYLHTSSLAERLKEKIQSRLSVYGLEVETLYLDQPSFRESDDLKRAGDMDERKKKLIRYAGKTINWEVQPFDIHMKNNKGFKASVRYSGNCTFKVIDQERFFQQPEIDGYLHSDPFVDEKTIKDYYAERISGLFAAKLASITQNMIDEHNWDVREMARYTENLKVPVVDTLNDLIGNWGLSAESVYLHNTSISQSSVLQDLGALENESAESEIEIAKNNLEKKTATEILRSDVEQAGKRDDIVTDAYDHAAGNEMRRSDADEKVKDKETAQALNEIRRGGMIGDAEHKSRLKGLDNRAEMDAHAISSQIQVDEEQRRREDLKKNHEYELERREEEQGRILEHIQQQAKIDDLKFRETLNGIMHSIDASNLEWQKKLDEYARLSRQLGIQDVQDARRIAAETDAEILRIQGKANADSISMAANSKYEAGIKGVQLNTAEAQLQETIDRYAEEREERKAAADYARKEKAAVLAFQQDLEARRLLAEEQMAFLKEQQEDAQRDREYNLRIAEMEKEIEKLRLELDAEKHKAQEEAGLGKVQSVSEARAKEAEYKYLAEKEEKNRAREDDMMNRADSLFRYVQSIQEGMESARQFMQLHADDNETSVRKAYAEAEKVRASGMNELQWTEIIKKLNELEKEIIRKEGTVNNSGSTYTSEAYEKTLKKIRKALDEIDQNRRDIEVIQRALILSPRTSDNPKKSCWACGCTVLEGHKFCGNCGARL